MSAERRTLEQALAAWWESHADSVIGLRRWLHAHPERSGAEYETTGRIVDELTGIGFAPVVLRSRPGTGVIATWDSGNPGPTVAVRADIDALGAFDLLDTPYRSRTTGLAHACGHDAHTSIVVALAGFLAVYGKTLQPKGRIRLLFEPAEETVPGGAVEMIAEGALDGVDAILGLHCDPKSDVGSVGLRSGPISAAADQMTVELIGPGGHTARPEETVDLVSVAARLILGLPERLHSAQSGLAAVFGAVLGGDAPNVIPTRVELRGSVRTADADGWESAKTTVQDALANIMESTGADWELDYTRGVPPVMNDPHVVEVVRTVLSEVKDPKLSVFEAPQSAGADTFAWYSRMVPACYMRLGTHDPSWPHHRDLHHGHFDIDERALHTGLVAVASAVFSLLDTLRTKT